MKILSTYIKTKIKSILAWLTICIIFALIFTLFDIPTKAVIYAAALSGFFALLYAMPDFISYRRKVLSLQRLADDIILSADMLPRPEGSIEEGYDELVRRLYANMKDMENKMNARYSDMTDYYTLWVHQIKTPISAMWLILQNSDDPESRELTDNLRSIEQYAEMVLCYLRLESDNSDYVIKEYDLDGIVRQAVRRYSSQFIRRKIKLIYEPLEATVLSDEKWLLFVIGQIISNALKYTPSGSIEIYLTAPLTLCIKDTGIGIAPEDIPRIFDKGYTGCNGRLDKKASGIGLYLCRRICTKLGHTISAESGTGGTTIMLGLDRSKTNTAD